MQIWAIIYWAEANSLESFDLFGSTISEAWPACHLRPTTFHPELDRQGRRHFLTQLYRTIILFW